MPKIPSRYASIVLPFLLSIVMTCVVSFVSTIQGLAPEQSFLPVWLVSWGASWVIGFPTLLLVLPFVRKLTGVLTESE